MSPESERPLTIDQLRLWLNDKIGKTVQLSLMVDFGGEGVAHVIQHEGELQHWISNVAEGDRTDTQLRDAIAATYMIGTADLELSTIGGATLRQLKEGELVMVDLVEGAWLTIYGP